jgi:hypothetical protein
MNKKHLLETIIMFFSITSWQLSFAQTSPLDSAALTSINALVLDPTQLTNTSVYTTQLNILLDIMNNAQGNVYSASTQNSFASALVQIFNSRSGQTNDALAIFSTVLQKAQKTPLLASPQQDYVKGMATMLSGEIALNTPSTTTTQSSTTIQQIEKTHKQLNTQAQNAAQAAQKTVAKTPKRPTSPGQKVTPTPQHIILPKIQESSITRTKRAVITEKAHLKTTPQ